MLEYSEERASVADYMRRLYERGLTTSLGGNISLRVEDIVLITPAKVDKGRLTAEQIGIVSMEGEVLTPDIGLSVETEMHLSVLRNRKDISAVIHAHPAIATFFAAADVDIDTTLTAEAFMVLGVPLKAPYAALPVSAGVQPDARFFAGRTQRQVQQVLERFQAVAVPPNKDIRVLTLY